MPDAKVYANGRSIIHAGDGLSQASATPDVCKTPSPNGPTPMAYSNVASDADLTKGAKRVKIAGKSAGIEDSFLKTSTGDEGGTAGGGLTSNKTKGKLTWVGASADVRFEGKGVIRFGDTCLHNDNNSNAGGQPTNAAPSTAQDDCTHANVRRIPEEGTSGYYDQERPGDGGLRAMEPEIRRKEKRVENIEKKIAGAQRAGKIELANELSASLRGLRGDLEGAKWEYAVGKDVNAQEMNVKIRCNDCDKIVAEYDVLMESGIVKECKRNWDLVSPKQLAVEIEFLEVRQVLGPGRTLHLALPKGERRSLSRKFDQTPVPKDEMRGRIQEH